MGADSAAKAAPMLGFGYSRAVRAQLGTGLVVLSLIFGSTAGGGRSAQAQDGGVLRGPHPFLKPNALALTGGYATATGGTMGGLLLKGAYEYELLGSFWLNLQMAFVDGSDEPADTRRCTSCGRAASSMAGLTYRLRMDVPVVLSGTLAGGFVFVFPDSAPSAMGLAVRPSVAARYFVYDWLGFGVELGSTLGFASHDADAGLSRGLGTLEALMGAEVQFDTP